MKRILIIATLVGVLCGSVAAYANTNVEKHTETVATTTAKKPTTTPKEKATATTEKKKEPTTEETTTEETEPTTEETEVPIEEAEATTATTQETDVDSEDDQDEFENPNEYEDDSLEKCHHEWSEKSIGYDQELGYVWDKTCKKCHSVVYEPATQEEYEQATNE